MSTDAVSHRLNTLRAAGFSVQEHGPYRYRVGPGISYWPSTDRWRSFRGGEAGYGVQSLIRFVRPPCSSG
jgi:hypothetical protein